MTLPPVPLEPADLALYETLVEDLIRQEAEGHNTSRVLVLDLTTTHLLLALIREVQTLRNLNKDQGRIIRNNLNAKLQRPSVLALDPGQTTGWAVVNKDGLYLTGEIWTGEAWSPMALRLDLQRLAKNWHPEVCVVERMPLTMTAQLRRLESVCLEVFPDAVRISPGEWKPRVTHRLHLSVHEREAYHLAQHYLRREGRA